MNSDLILGILIGYCILVISIGLFFSKKIKSSKSFFLADRSLGWFPVTATITATAVGGSATIATAKLIYLYGLPSLWLDIGAACGLVVLGLTLAKIVRKTGKFSLPEITGSLFDDRVRYAAAGLIVLTQIAWVSLLIQGAGAIVAILIPFNYTVVLTVITIVFVVYTVLGGQFAVVYTDIIQFFVMLVGICFIAAPLLFLKASSGFGSISSDVFSFPVNANYGFVSIASLFFMMFMPNLIGPDIYSKLLSARDEKSASLGALFSGFMRVVFAVSIAVIALSAIVLVPGLNASEAVFAMPRAIAGLDPVVAGLVLAAMISVMLSSADSVLISSGTVLSVDLIRKKNILISRFGILIIGFLALGLALYLNDIIQTLKLAYTVFTGGLTLPILFGFYKEKTRVTSFGAFVSLIFGGSISVIWFFMDNPYNVDAVLVGLIVSLVPLLVLREKK